MPPDQSYQQTIDYLYALQKHGIKLALSNSLSLMELMGHPDRKFRSVHVAGTNGKGSTSAFIASMLREAGYRVGLYSSPHLISFTERIRIDNVPLPERKIVELASRVRNAYQRMPPAGTEAISPTFFEVTTAMAFTCFAEAGVDIAVVEAGMGGRLDATNIIRPEVSVITNIDIEHAEFLGDTLELIAAEKAGIIKPGVPVVTGAVQPGAVGVIETASAGQSPLYLLGRDFEARKIASPLGRRFDYHGIHASYKEIATGMLGRHQVDNACLALAAVECLTRAGMAVQEPALRRGLERTRWEGRLELVSRKPDIYLDGAHNPASAKRLAAAVRDLKSSYRGLTLVIGILGDKDYQGILSELAPLADRVIVTRPQYSRAMDVQALAAEVRAVHGAVDAADTVASAITAAASGAGPDELILITGSLYVVGDARAFFSPGSEQGGALSALKG